MGAWGAQGRLAQRWERVLGALGARAASWLHFFYPPECPNPLGLLLPQIDEPNSFGNTALHIACYMGQDAVANELVNYGANVNQPNEKGFTPLHFAAVSTNGALCLELLVNNGADVNFQVWC